MSNLAGAKVWNNFVKQEKNLYFVGLLFAQRTDLNFFDIYFNKNVKNF
jgi:hypothetical protein